MKQHLFILIAIGIFTTSNAQNCIAHKISKEFDFEISLVSKDQNSLGKAEIIISIFDKKKSVKTQTINLESEFILKSKSFNHCGNIQSYSANEYLKSDENDFGDLIVADLNFDGKEDIAIKREEGGNGGPVYNFYIQTTDQQFIIDKYLSNEMSYFPDYLDSKEKTLHVYKRVDTLTDEGITYLFKDASKTWSVIKQTTYRN